MKKLLLTVMAATSLAAVSCNKARTDAADKRVDTMPMMVMQIQKCSRLYTTEYHVHKIITHDDKVSLRGSFMKKDYNIDLPIGKRSIAIPMDATIKAYIDFGNFSEANVRRQGDKVEVTLPDPRVAITSTRINHKEIKQYVALLRHDFSDEELTSYERQGKEAIVSDIPKMGIIETARESAARILIPMIEQMGFKENDITISFRKDLNTAGYEMLLDKSTIEHGKEKK